MIKTESEYDKQAREFTEAASLTIEKNYTGHRLYFPEDKEQRGVWQITFNRPRKQPYSFTFGQSVAESYEIRNFNVKTFKGELMTCQQVSRVRGYKEALRAGGGEFQYIKMTPSKTAPSDYSVLACLDANCPISFSEFCSEFGYEEDSIKAKATWEACLEQTANLQRMFNGPELEALGEIS